MIPETIDRLLAGDALSAGDTEEVIGLVMQGEADAAQIAGLLIALRGKGENAIGVSHIDGHGWIVLAIGLVVSFIVAYAAVAWFLAWVRRRGFAPFAVYRIVVGCSVLAWALGYL